MYGPHNKSLFIIHYLRETTRKKIERFKDSNHETKSNVCARENLINNFIRMAVDVPYNKTENVLVVKTDNKNLKEAQTFRNKCKEFLSFIAVSYKINM